jgi:hypothetical protein
MAKTLVLIASLTGLSVEEMQQLQQQVGNE